MSDRQNVLIILVVLALFVGSVVGLALGSFGTYVALTAVPADEELASSTVPPVNVQVEIIRPEPEREDAFMLPAVVEANRVVRVAAEVAGRIEEINCKEGDLCEPPPPGEEDKAKPLIELNTELLQAELERAQAAAQLARDDLRRIEKLLADGAGTEQDRARAKATMLTTKAAEKLASVRLKRAKIFPPIRGVLNDLLVEKGEYVQRGDPVAEIVDIEAVKVVARVPELDVQFLKTGDPAWVAVDIRAKEHRFVGKITYISSLADEGTRATRVEITLDNKQRLLRSGQIVRVHLTRQTLKNVIMVPLSAVIPLENEKAVYVVETVEEKDEKTGKTVKKDVARRRSVTLDARLIKTIEQTVTTRRGTRTVRQQIIRVTNGALKAGDRLIVTGHQFVAAGQEVRPEVLQFDAQPKNTPEK